MTRAVGLFALAIATLALAGCGDGGAAVFHNTVARGHNRIAVAEKKFQITAEESWKGKGQPDFDKMNSHLEAYRAAVAEAKKEFESVPVPKGEVIPDLQKAYRKYLEQCDASGRDYETVCQAVETPRKEKRDVRKIFEAEARNKKPLADELERLRKKLVEDFSLKVK